MKIGMLLSTPLPPVEGIGFYAWNLARFLVSEGHEVQLITRGQKRQPLFETLDGIPVWRPPFIPLYPIHVHLHSLHIRKLLKKLEPDLDLLHAHSPLVRMPRSRLPVLATFHTPMKADVGSIPWSSSIGLVARMQLPFSISLERTLIKRAAQITAVASSVALELGEYGLDPSAVKVLGNGVDTALFRPAAARPSETPYFLTAGRLGARKGLEDLIDAAALVLQRFPQASFKIAGGGPLQAQLLERIRRLGLDGRVTFLGHIADRCQMAALYQNALAYIHPAHYEGLATVMLEAMACGLPLIATAVSGALDVIREGENGLMAPPHQPGALAAAALRLLEEPALGDRLGAAARRTVCERYDWRIIGQRYLAEYRALLKGGRS